MSKGYKIGQRNPGTLPGAYKDSETTEMNQRNTAYWQSLRKKIVGNFFIGSKY